MDYHIGLAFSIEQITYVIFESPGMMISAVGTAAYPFNYEEDIFTQQEARISLTSVLRNVLDSNDLNPTSLSFSIESNLAVLERIIYPENLEETGITDHIAWHLSESLNLPLSEYVYIRSTNISKRNRYNEELVISIQKKIINFFRNIAADLDLPLRNLTVHHLAAEIVLNSALSEQMENLMILFKIASNRLESSFFLNGTYYKSHCEHLQRANSSDDFHSDLVNKIKQEIGYIENLFGTDGPEQIPVDRLLLYGPVLNESLLAMIQKNMSIPVDRFNPLLNITVSDHLLPNLTEESASQYVECIGAALDQ